MDPVAGTMQRFLRDLVPNPDTFSDTAAGEAVTPLATAAVMPSSGSAHGDAARTGGRRNASEASQRRPTPRA
jgi:hypothetical protein